MAGSLGRSRFGGGAGQLTLLSLGAGFGVALVLSLIAVNVIDFAEGPLWAGANLTFTLGLVLSVVAWFLFVDRTSLPKAPTRPKDTIEARWSERAASATYRDMLLLLCAATLTAVGFQIVADIRLDVPLLLIGPALTLVAAFDHQLRYAMLKRAEG